MAVQSFVLLIAPVFAPLSAPSRQDMEDEPTIHGICLEGVGDLNGDGVPDVIAGAGLDDGRNGLVVALSGRDLREIYSIEGSDRGGLGFSLSQIADQDRDGVADLVAGAPFFREQRGRVEIRSGASGRLLLALDGTRPEERFGYAVEEISDISGDGLDDVAIGAPGLHPESTGFGRTYFAGAQGGAIVRWVGGRNGGDRFGSALARCGDADGDGLDDLAIGAWRGGYVQIVSPRPGSVISSSEGATRWDGYGSDLTSASDLDGDGSDDLLVAARAGVTERLRLVSSATGVTLRSTTCGSSCAASVSCLLDCDGDGASDFAVGDPGYPLHVVGPMGVSLGPLAGSARADGKKPGSVSLFSGRDLTVLTTLQGWEDDDWFGSDAILGADADQDGERDVVVAAGLGSRFQVAIYSLDGRMIAGARFGTSPSPSSSPPLRGATKLLPGLLASLIVGAVFAILLESRRRRSYRSIR